MTWSGILCSILSISLASVLVDGRLPRRDGNEVFPNQFEAELTPSPVDLQSTNNYKSIVYFVKWSVSALAEIG